MERVLKKPNKVNQKYAELADLKEQLGRKSKDPSKVASRFAGNDLKPRVMKRILGINADGSTNDITQNDGMMDLEDDTDALEKRTRSKIRSATRNRTISQKRDLTPMEEVTHKDFPVLTFLGFEEAQEALRQESHPPGQGESA